jgi:hypothetical protein
VEILLFERVAIPVLDNSSDECSHAVFNQISGALPEWGNQKKLAFMCVLSTIFTNGALPSEHTFYLTIKGDD